MLKMKVSICLSVLFAAVISVTACRNSVSGPVRVIAELNNGETMNVKLVNGE